jgi:hypothetical protein
LVTAPQSQINWNAWLYFDSPGHVKRATILLGAPSAARKINIQMSQFERSEYDNQIAGCAAWMNGIFKSMVEGV